GRIAQAIEYRARRGVNPRLCRIVWSESDGLPGVIIDRYGDVFVLQTLTLGMDMRKALIVEALATAGGAPALQSIIERNDAVVRRAEGMEPQVSVLFGEAPAETEIEVAGLRLSVDLMHAQKTGFYLDQLPHYESVAGHAAGRRVLDCFTSQGAFALACARANGAAVTAVEGSAESLTRARGNAERNSLRVDWIEQDVFQFLR